jgi:nucleotide-binding universal stress UspA family protein
MHIVVAAKPDADQPWLAEAVTNLAKQTGGTVAVVAADGVELERLASVPRSVFTQQAEHAAGTMARRLADRGVAATQTVLAGKALPAILGFADEQKADLIVVGSTSRPAVTERLLGSVPLDLIKKSSRPVLVITHPDHAKG